MLIFACDDSLAYMTTMLKTDEQQRLRRMMLAYNEMNSEPYLANDYYLDHRFAQLSSSAIESLLQDAHRLLRLRLAGVDRIVSSHLLYAVARQLNAEDESDRLPLLARHLDSEQRAMLLDKTHKLAKVYTAPIPSQRREDSDDEALQSDHYDAPRSSRE